MTANAGRTRCTRCLRPPRACICAAAHPVAHAVQVLILMHPLEVHEAKGTARLLHLCLPHSRIAVGETFDPTALQRWLHAPWEGADQQAPRQALLLYPPTPDALGQPAVPAPEPAPGLHAPTGLRLVVLDGTWRKSRKMLWRNPALQALPRLSLHAPPPSRYHTLRPSHAPHQRSTLEAVHQALVQLEPDNTTLQALHGAMQAFVHQHQQQRQQHRPPVGNPRPGLAPLC